jgi:Domain of unknown function (DUF4278)
MKLTYRGNAYEIPAPIQPGSDSTDRPQIKLIYRGHTYYTTPRHVVVSEEDKTDWQTVTLIYRGNTYERKLQSPKPDRKPRAINWRWQF